jgi:glycosyltransferase involved in cell wall biosynthesis
MPPSSPESISSSCKNIFLIANYELDAQYSMQNLANLFYRLYHPRVDQVRVIRPLAIFGRFSDVYLPAAKWLGYIDKYLIFPFYLLYVRYRADLASTIFHIVDHSNALYAPFLYSAKVIVTCNDVLAIRAAKGHFFGQVTGVFGKILQALISYGLRCATHIVCISSNTRSELLNLLDLDPNSVSVALLPLNHQYCRLSQSQSLSFLASYLHLHPTTLAPGFILHVGGNEWYKNRIGVCHIYQEYFLMASEQCIPIVPLVLAGKPISLLMADFIKANSHLPIYQVNQPSTLHLQSLYSLASLLLFPSHHEGFGWPILEAMACGCPVVTTERPPMTEVAGSAGFYIDPTNHPQSARLIIETLAANPHNSPHWIRAAANNLLRFSPEAFNHFYLNLISALT